MRGFKETATASLMAVAFSLAASQGPARAADDLIGLVTKTEVPFFVTMREAAQAEAKRLGLNLQTFAGKDHGDSQSQIAAVESLMAAGAKGFAIVPADPAAIAPLIGKARAAGMLVVDLDTIFEPVNTADATFATDNRLAGKKIGEYARKKLGPAASTASVALLDFSDQQVTVDYLRDQGFMEGFGFNIGDPNRWGDENDPRICGHFMTGATEEGGRTGMEQALQKCPDLKVVYAINEQTSSGAAEALKSAGKNDGSIMLVTIDGGCDGVKNVKDGLVAATSMQFPKSMGTMAMDALQKFIKTGEKPVMPTDPGFINTGAELVTDQPIEGLKSMDTTAGLKQCWG